MWSCCVIACAPCCFWSSIWRVVACPMQCLFNGCGFACSNNTCTNGTDECMRHCVHEIQKPVEFAAFDVNKASKEDLVAVSELVAKLYLHFYGLTYFNRMHYTLCDVIVRPLTGTLRTLPGNTCDVLRSFAGLVKLQMDNLA